MLRLAYLTLVLILGLGSAQAQQSEGIPERPLLPVVLECEKTEVLFEKLTNEYGEEPMMIGHGVVVLLNRQLKEGLMGLWFNRATTSYSITATFEEGVTCYVFIGNSLRPYELPGLKL